MRFRFSQEKPVVVVTGAGRGLGQSIALAFAGEGARVAINDLQLDQVKETLDLIEQQGGSGIDVVADIADMRQVEGLYAKVEAELGPVSILINNAAFYEFVPSLQQSEENWQRTFDVDVTGIWHMVRGALPHMRRLGGGAIVNVASANAFFTIPQNTSYATAKAGVVALTRGLALELGRMGVRINSICPGFCATPAVELYLQALPDERRESEMGKYDSRVPLGRLDTPAEAANLCLFLSSENSSYVHGTHFAGDGGMWAVNKAFSFNP
jgi:NAD(P)-dependent dehydrogenase (short-subunit alcohol dehydrogenase family)